MNSNCTTSTIQQREAILFASCQNLFISLKTIEPAAIHMFLNFGYLPGVYDEIMLMLESQFKGHVMNFACTGSSLIEWNKEPAVALDFEFLHNGIFAFFRLFIDGADERIEIHHISFDRAGNSPEKNTKLLRTSIFEVKKQ